MINTVFLDMDGVIADFHKGIYDAFRQPYRYDESLATWDFWDNWKPPLNRENINAKCSVYFWEHLPWTHDGLEIFEIVCSKFKPEQIHILTNPIVGGAGTATGKILWIEKYLPEFVKRVIITQAPKGLLAKPDTLLIDDNNNYVDGFREAGGKALLVPRPWNRAHLQAGQTVKVVRKFLERVC